MIETTKAIVINSIKYGDTSLIETCYTENCGLKSYMLKGVLKAKKAKIKTAYFQPLMQLNLTANHNNKGSLNSIREIEVVNFYHSIYSDIKKQSIALFLAEILSPFTIYQLLLLIYLHISVIFTFIFCFRRNKNYLS